MHRLGHWTKEVRTIGAGILVLVCIAATLPIVGAQESDSVEFLNGTVLKGTITKIDTQKREFTFESTVAGKTVIQTLEYAKVHAAVMKGRRFEITPMPATKPGEANELSEAEVRKLIDDAGSKLPDWFAKTTINAPATLDLNWPLNAGKGWNNRKNVGQYIWDIVNPNERRWREGIKLVHQCLEAHKGDRALTDRDTDKLGTMYFTLLQDYPRAAYYLEKTRPTAAKPSGVFLAECYWRLGNKAMALKMLRNNRLAPSAIKLLGDMGEVDRAVALAKQLRNSQAMNEAFLAAGDSLRAANRLDEAVDFYKQVISENRARNEEYKQRFHARARGSIEAIQLFDRVDFQNIKDGKYVDQSTGYNGPVKVEATIASGTLTSLKVTSHKEKQFYAALTDTPKQVIEKQSIRKIDGTSGATITSQAIIHATARALSKGSKL